MIEILKKQPDGTKILIEDSDGGSSDLLNVDDVTNSWEREEYDQNGNVIGNEYVMMLTKFKE